MLLKRTLLSAITFLGIFSLFIFCELPYVNKTAFLLPLPEEVGLTIRNDRWGKGHFGASRKNRRTHQGADLEAEIATPVFAPLSGKVIKAGFNQRAGNYLKLYHPPDTTTYYCHLDSLKVKKGQRVKQKQLIALVGKSGNASHPQIKPHLHFELGINGNMVDPIKYMLQKRSQVADAASE